MKKICKIYLEKRSGSWFMLSLHEVRVNVGLFLYVCILFIPRRTETHFDKLFCALQRTYTLNCCGGIEFNRTPRSEQEVVSSCSFLEANCYHR
jgi:hypothetical protein